MMKNNLLKQRFSSLIDDSEVFLEYSGMPLRKSIRVNNLKTSVNELKETLENQNFKLKPIPWTLDGFWVEGPKLSDTNEYYLGHYYIQEASMMIPPLILDLQPESFVFDAAAAPGGKTVHIANLMNKQGTLIANEPNPKRRSTLIFNLAKHGVLNTVVTKNDLTEKFSVKEKLDYILLDAPCSCEGQFRKNPESLNQWSFSKIKRCSHLQKKILVNTLNLLKAGGTLVYSTCTLAPEENEEVIDHALQVYDDLTVESIGKQKFKYRPGVTSWRNNEFNQQLANTIRVYPQDNDTEGFYLAKIMKNE